MRNITSLLVLFVTFGASAAYADNFHVENHSTTDVVASVYFFDGAKPTSFTLKPKQERVYPFWHNLVAKIVLTNPKTQQSCSLEVAERVYVDIGFLVHRPKYEPLVMNRGNDCAYFSSFNQADWQISPEYRTHWENFSTVDIWAPWS